MSKRVYTNTDKTGRHASRCSSVTGVMASSGLLQEDNDDNKLTQTLGITIPPLAS